MPNLISRISAPAKRRHFGLFSRILLASEVHAQRSRLARLDDHILDDIGVTRTAADAEAGRPIWDVPNHWKW